LKSATEYELVANRQGLAIDWTNWDLEKPAMPIWNFMMRALLGTVLTFWLGLLAGQPALADKRVALVIGNS
jgi:hypothetical protein